MATTIDQQIAAAEAKLARLREKSRSAENGQKFVLGGMLLAAVRTDANMRRWFLAEAAKVTRPADVKRLAPLVAELSKPEPQA